MEKRLCFEILRNGMPSLAPAAAIFIAIFFPDAKNSNKINLYHKKIYVCSGYIFYVNIKCKATIYNKFRRSKEKQIKSNGSCRRCINIINNNFEN